MVQEKKDETKKPKKRGRPKGSKSTYNYHSKTKAKMSARKSVKKKEQKINKLKKTNEILIGSAGGMTRLSTGYTFLNIQEHSKYIRENIENIANVKKYKISTKYQFLDEIFLRVLEKHPEKMSDIFFKMFKASPKTVIKFLSNKSNFYEDLKIISQMPKLTFIKALFY